MTVSGWNVVESVEEFVFPRLKKIYKKWNKKYLVPST